MDMPKTDQEFKELARKCALGIATESEQQAFDQIYQNLSSRYKNWDSQLMGNEDFIKQKIYDKLEQNIAKHNLPEKNYTFFKYAASLIILFSIALLIFKQNFKANQQNHISLTQRQKAGADSLDYQKAYLTLANGKKISLTDAEKGNVLQEAGIIVSKTAEGQVVYKTAGNIDTNNDKITTNTISTPSGGQYMVILPDNSQVWLNASSSITFPTVFEETERNVSITGEVYFEVFKAANKPFKVKTGTAEVTVLGTHFNMMNYGDEPINRITLLEGSIQLKLGNSVQVIKPGQQAYFKSDQDKIALKEVDTDEVISWKKGYFLFDNTPIDQVMREIKRWYDVDVVYEGRKPEISITAMISRKNKITKMLDLLKKSGGLDFQINNKQIIVKKFKEETK